MAFTNGKFWNSSFWRFWQCPQLEIHGSLELFICAPRTSLFVLVGFFKVLFIGVCVWACVCLCAYTVSMQKPVEAEKGIRNPGTGLTGSWEPPSIGGGNWTQVLCRNSWAPLSAEHLSSPICVLQAGSPCVSLPGTCSCLPPHVLW